MECTNIYDPEIDTTHLYQGDIFKRFDAEYKKKVLPYVNPPELAFMVLNYTCDLVNPKDLSYIIICPIFKLKVLIEGTLKGLISKYPDKEKRNIVKELSSFIKRILNYEQKFIFFLTNSTEFEGSHAFADLLRIATIPIKYINIVLDNRIKSLKSPWREKLGWKIGYMFNRVGLPDTTSNNVEDYLKSHSIIRSYLDEL